MGIIAYVLNVARRGLDLVLELSVTQRCSLKRSFTEVSNNKQRNILVICYYVISLSYFTLSLN